MSDKSGCLLGWLLAKGRGDGGERLPAVKVNDRFVTAAEASFYRVLGQVVGDRAVILMQVSLQQLLYFPGSNRDNPLRAS